MAKDTTAADIGVGPSMLPVTSLPAGVKAAYASGPDVDRVDNGKIVAYAIRVRANLKVGDREFSGDVCLHEAVMLRRFYEDVGSGSVNLVPEWPPGLERLIPLTQPRLQRELTRMMENFVVPRNNTILVVPTAFLGSEPAEQLQRLHKVMQRQMEAWAALVEKAKGRIGPMRSKDPVLEMSQAFEHITSRELEEVANIADPSRDGVGDIELPEVLVASPASQVQSAIQPTKTLEQIRQEVDAEEPSEDAHEALIGRLMAKAELSQQQAMSVAAVVDLVDGSEISDDALSEAIGSKAKAKLEAVRRALKAG